MEKVKAAVMTGVGKMDTKEFDRPKVEDESLLLKIEMTGVCGTDIHIFRGHLPGITFPIIPGHEIVGTVEEMGKKANETMIIFDGNLSVGDRITLIAGITCGKCFYCRQFPHYDNLCVGRKAYGSSLGCREPPYLFGGYAEYMYLLPRSMIFKVPKGMPLEVAVLTEPTAVATRALERAFQPGVPFSGQGFGLGSTVVVQGAGPIGILVTASAKAAGAGKVIVIDPHDVRLALAQEFGADYTINVKEHPKVEDRVMEVMKLTDGHGADVVIECTGKPAAFKEGIEFPRRGGKYVEVGQYADAGPIDVRPHTICKKDLDVLGSWVFPKTQFKVAFSLLGSGRFPFEKLVSHKFKIEDAEKAFDAVDRREATKAAIVPQ